MKRVASAILMSIVGFCVGGISAGLATCFVYGIGSWIGAPTGGVVGASFGWRTPLRDATIIFFFYCALFAEAVRNCQGALQSIDGLPKLFVWALVLGPGGAYFPRLPVRLFTFSQRRLLAIGFSATSLVAVLAALLWWLRQP